MLRGMPADVDPSLTDLVALAQLGDERSWTIIVTRLERVVWKSVNMCTRDPDLRNDAFAATWLRLAERLDTIREPEKLPGWLATTATNEARQLLRKATRQPVSVDWEASDAALADVFRQLEAVGDSADGLMRQEAALAVRSAFEQLDDECRTILTVLVLDVDTSYRDASEQLQRPVGALGPSRRRCLEKLRSNPAIQRYVEGDHGRG